MAVIVTQVGTTGRELRGLEGSRAGLEWDPE